ncbi:MAG TPA: hypothetical protein PK760_09100, partial [Flavobacteriales bacterium]|nr:hypothetical protein [Flavobacteriales bacterium]
IAQLRGATMPRLEFRQALFRSPVPDWQHRLYRAALVVTTIAMDRDERNLAVDHQVMRFSLLYNNTWPEPVFKDIRRWSYKPVELREDAPVRSWLVEIRLRELRLGPEEWVEVVFLG